MIKSCTYLRLENQLPSRNNDVLNALERLANDIINDIPDFYRYDYGRVSNELRDGGNGMFLPFGMQVTVLKLYKFMI